jgi:hypothetical protein
MYVGLLGTNSGLESEGESPKLHMQSISESYAVREPVYIFRFHTGFQNIRKALIEQRPSA